MFGLLPKQFVQTQNFPRDTGTPGVYKVVLLHPCFTEGEERSFQRDKCVHRLPVFSDIHG